VRRDWRLLALGLLGWPVSNAPSISREAAIQNSLEAILRRNFAAESRNGHRQRPLTSHLSRLTSHTKLLSPFFPQGCPGCGVVSIRLGFFLLPLAEFLSPLALGLAGRVSYLVIEILFFGLERVLFGRPLIVKQAKRLLLSFFVLCVRGWPWRRPYHHRSWPCELIGLTGQLLSVPQSWGRSRSGTRSRCCPC
jgi:hypothetical protein